MAPFLRNSAGVLRQSVGKVVWLPSVRLRVPLFAPRPNGRCDEELKDMFEEWMIEHNKSYDSLEEKEKRFQIYKETVREIDEHNTTYDPFRMLKINHFSDLTWSELASNHCRRSWDHKVFNRVNHKDMEEA